LRWLSSLFLVPDAYVGWLPFAWWTVRRRLAAGGIDVVVTTSSPDTAHLVGLLLGRRHASKWVADFRDPWVRRLTFRAPTKLHLWVHTMLERRVLERADRVLVTNRETRDDFLARHPSLPDHRFAIIPNGFDPDDLTAAAAVPAPFAGEGGKLKLLHSGLLSGRRTLAPVLDALARLAAERPGLDQRLLLLQLGPCEEINERLVRQRRLERCVRFLPAVDHVRVLAAMRAADALVLLEHGSERGALITPGKIFEYLASRRPILAVVPEGPAAELVRELEAGVVVAPDHAAAIAAILAAWLEGGPPASGVDEARLAPYTRSALSERLAAVLDELCD
jgi:glycosyltransferase involved in cell wall biosynthesis